MDKCFLFAQKLNKDGCFCLKISKEGELISPPAQRNYDEIKLMQTDSTTVVVETASNASLLQLELSWLPERKARVAIPYALEDKLAQPLEELHFAFDKNHYHNNHYLIAVLEKYRLQHIINLLDEHHIHFDSITLDWFALSPSMQVMQESSLLVNQDDFKGALSENLARTYLKLHALNETEVFTDSQKIPDFPCHENNEESCVWLAKRLLSTSPMNLCQGSMQRGAGSDWFKKNALIAGGLFCFWLLSILLVNLIQLYLINKEHQQLDKKIEVIYHQFFPQAQQVISPKFRISQLLDSNKSGNQTHFWFLLNQFAKAMSHSQIKTEDLKYQNNILFVTLVSSDFSKLEALKNSLKKLQLTVKQTQASTREQQVIATLELK